MIGDSSVVSNSEVDKAKLWHKRLGHISERGLQELSKQKLLCGDKIESLEFCEQCVLGKSTRIKFKTGQHTTTRPFEYVHSDLWGGGGAARTQTLCGGKYFLSIIDDFSRRVWVFILKSKDQAFSKFREWCINTETRKETKLKYLRTDNGLEFQSKEFADFCKSKGITRHNTVRHTPQQNGLVEMMNRTLLERVRCMLLNAGLPKSFWGEAVTTAAYLINRSPSSAIKFKTPMEMWNGKPADYSNLRVFVCKAYAHIKQDKLGARALRCE